MNHKPEQQKQHQAQQNKRVVQAAKKPNLFTNQETTISPYIIHLSHEAEAPTSKTPSHLEKLAQSLIIDRDLLEESPSNIEEDANDLIITFDEIAQQFEEPETYLEHTHIESSAPEETITNTEHSNYQAAKLASYLVEKQLFEEAPQQTVEEEPAPQIILEILEEKPIAQQVETQIKIRTTKPYLRLRTVAMCVVLSCAFLFPIHAVQQVYAVKTTQSTVTESGKQAIEQLFAGTQALEANEFLLAQNDFAHASETFKQAEHAVKNMSATVQLLASVLPQTEKTYKSANGLITAGQEFSKTAELLTRAANEIQNRTSISATVKLTILSAFIENALPHLQIAEKALAQVETSSVPAEYQAQITELKNQTPALKQAVQEFVTFSDALSTLLGNGKKMRYLVLFQNNTELRATGGFPGSFAEIDVLNGEIVNVHIPGGGTYDLQGQLNQFVESPAPLSLINPRWEFHDSNWFPDFPTSAKKLLWFYEHAGGPTIDGVIAINATVMPELLELTGPIEMPEYNRVIDSENFLFETQKIVEIEYDQFKNPEIERENEAPKQFIGDLAPIMLEQLKEADMNTTLNMLALLGEKLEEKDVLIYLQENELQSKIETLGWAGKVKQTTGDYLMVINTNLGGGKTDTVIDQTIDIDSEVQKDGSIINTVTITKIHRGIETALFQGVNNVDYIRLYTPKGSELLSATGFEIPPAELFEAYEVPLNPDPHLQLLVTDMEKHAPSETDIWTESGKTVFGNWIQTKPGETEVITFTYKLPISLKPLETEQTLLQAAKARLGFKDLETHSLFLQKQPGVLTRITNYTLTLPNQKSIIWSSEVEPNKAQYSNKQDAMIQLLIENTFE